MIPYGVHVVTTMDAGGQALAGTVHWVMQSSFDPPLVSVALRPGSPLYQAIRLSNRFAVHMLGKDDGAEAFAFRTRPAIPEGDTLSGWGFKLSPAGLPLLNDAIGVLECTLRAVIEFGDHHPLMGEVTEAFLRLPEQGRPDEMILHLRELGQTQFYGG